MESMCQFQQAGLVIEVDGDVHDLQKEEDERRERVLSALGVRVVRFMNDEVVRDLSAVVGRIREFTLHPFFTQVPLSISSPAQTRHAPM